MGEHDPRLRILDPAASGLAAPILAALDATTVVIHLGRDVTDSARIAAGALVAMTARLFGHVEIRCDLDDGAVLPTNWWGVPDLQTLARRAAHLIKPQAVHSAPRTVTVTVGAADSDNTDFGIGGDDYTAHIARRPVPVHAGTHHLGVHAAACLAVSQVLGLILGEHGLPVVELAGDYQLDLLGHRPISAEILSDDTAAANASRPGYETRRLEIPSPLPDAPLHRGDGVGRDAAPPGRPAELVFGGAGSAGSSAIALTATALAPAITGRPAPPGVSIVVVDLDRFDADRNPFRYPALLGGETDEKALALAARLRELGLNATGHTVTVGSWAAQRDHPGVHGVLISSVDTLAGRLEVADVVAEQTLSIGVSGLVLHAQRERMDGAAACPFCDYVDTAPALTQADVYVDLTGLELPRVLQLLDHAAPLVENDVAIAVAAGKLDAARAPDLVGHRLEDLVNRVYAEAQIHSAAGTPVATVAFPQVSWFAGVLAAVEIVKQIQGLPLLRGRVDVDLAGLPPGALRVMPQDPSGRCVCHSGPRRRAYHELYLATSASPPAGTH